MKSRAFSTAMLLATAMTTRAFSDTALAPPLKVQTFGNIPYVSGGVGADERDKLIAMGRDDNLRLSFALKDGDFLGGAQVEIKNQEGKEILDAPASGPLFFAKLPAGNYTIEATTMGQTLTHTVVVPTKGQSPVYFIW